MQEIKPFTVNFLQESLVESILCSDEGSEHKILSVYIGSIACKICERGHCILVILSKTLLNRKSPLFPLLQ